MFDINTNRVVVISDSEGIVVRGIIGKLSEQRIHVDFIGDTEDKLMQNSTADIFIVSLGSEKTAFINTMKRLCEITKNTGQRVLVIGERMEFDNIEAAVPDVKRTDHMGRPVDLDRLVDYIMSYEKPVEKPSPETEAAAPEKAPGASEEDDGVMRVLIVDDDVAYAKMVRGWLKDVYKTAVVTSGMQALTYMLKNKVDLVLLDYDMPVVSGAQVLEMMREEEAIKDVPVIFLTGISSLDTVKKVMALKPAGYILKSSPCVELLDKVSEVMNK